MSALYVALGDSMSIDEYAGGAGRGAASLLHRNRDGDFPEWTGRDLASAGYELAILASDGATSAHVLDHQLGLIPESPNLVTLSVGGNDLFLAYASGTSPAAAVAGAAANIDTVLGRIRERYRAAPMIVVTTVYDPTDGTGEIPGSGLPPWPEGPELLRCLNEKLAGLAAAHGALVADVHGRFLGHGQRVGDPAQPLPRPDDRDLWYCQVIEPNAWGASEIRAAWWDAMAGMSGPGR